MWQWFEALVSLLSDDLVNLAIVCMMLLPGPILGAAIGSIRRWYWARWQVGLIIGGWLGIQCTVIGFVMVYVGEFRDRIPIWALQRWSLFVWVIVLLFGMAAACGTSLFAAKWLHRTESYWVRTFRAHPWRWMRARSVRIMAIGIVAMILFVWLSARWNEIPLRAVQKKWLPFPVTIGGSPRGLILSTQHPEGLSPGALALLDDGPWPFITLSISSKNTFQSSSRNEVHDRDVFHTVSSLTTIQDILLAANTELTDECLFTLVDCPKLERLTIANCPSITLAGVNQFHSLRPDVTVYFTEPGQRMQTFSSQ